ncbi:restriction endonuclease subunit S [Aliikangiella coralliicola]|uniref:Restriction endonuclease subunit S n=1 Tax=Aliikangiella coralliicola TaxID=2592383 RepID=A0A545UDL5_9GAMM|nr:restriction endonuclease subunit S [Aliikangiella coralliicola]TQV87562.1 restriction endonuclease subunit S [Aliikangiella coralliicola]
MSDFVSTIGDIAQVFDGPHATPKKIEEGPYFLSISSLEKGALDLSKSAHVSEEDFKKWTKRVTPKEGDVLFSYETRLGDAALMLPGITACLGRRMGLLRPNREKVIPEYLLYAYLSPAFQETIRANTIHGATVDRIALKEMPSFEIRIPPIDEQKRTVEVLKALDAKIELNRQTNQTLEQIAQAIFRSWFVDFDPTRAKIAAKQSGQDPERAAMAAISGKSLEEINRLCEEHDEHGSTNVAGAGSAGATLKQLKETAALFPDALVDSELGEIPAGWGTGKLSDLAEFKRERFEVSELTFENYISTENMLENKSGITRASSLPKVKTVPRFEKGDILVSNIRPYFKKIWLAHFEGGRSGDVLGFKCKEPDQVEYLYNFLYQDSFFEFMMLTSKGAKMPRGDKNAIQGLEIILPSNELRKRYSSLVKFFYPKSYELVRESETLKNIRNMLLPKLLSGDIDPLLDAEDKGYMYV